MTRQSGTKPRKGCSPGHERTSICAKRDRQAGRPLRLHAIAVCKPQPCQSDVLAALDDCDPLPPPAEQLLRQLVRSHAGVQQGKRLLVPVRLLVARRVVVLIEVKEAEVAAVVVLARAWVHGPAQVQVLRNAVSIGEDVVVVVALLGGVVKQPVLLPKHLRRTGAGNSSCRSSML